LRGCPRLRLGGDVAGWGIDPAPFGVGDVMACLSWPGKAEVKIFIFSQCQGVFLSGFCAVDLCAE
jgi:hypothetical protein